MILQCNAAIILTNNKNENNSRTDFNSWPEQNNLQRLLSLLCTSFAAKAEVGGPGPTTRLETISSTLPASSTLRRFQVTGRLVNISDLTEGK